MNMNPNLTILLKEESIEKFLQTFSPDHEKRVMNQHPGCSSLPVGRTEILLLKKEFKEAYPAKQFLTIVTQEVTNKTGTKVTVQRNFKIEDHDDFLLIAELMDEGKII